MNRESPRTSKTSEPGGAVPGSLSRYAAIFTLVVLMAGGVCMAVSAAVSVPDAVPIASFSISVNLVVGWLVFLMLSLYRCRETAGWRYLATAGIRVLVVVLAAAFATSVRPEWKSPAFVLNVTVVYLAGLLVETSAAVARLAWLDGQAGAVVSSPGWVESEREID